MNATDLVKSPFQDKPCYRYIRKADKLPKIGVVNHDDDLACKVRLFNPTGIGTWWIAAYDPETEIAFGVTQLQFTEVGDFYMPELVAIRGQFGLPLERDLYYSPMTIKEVLRDNDRR